MSTMSNQAGSIPAHGYFEGEAFQHEKRTIFATEWQMLGRADSLVQPGSFVTNNLGGWPVFAIVDASGAVSAFRNVCRHQGMQVLEKPAGCCEIIRCRYHGWTYDLRGKWVTAPDMVAPRDTASPDNSLWRISSDTWRGLLFVNIDRNAPPLTAALSDIAAVADQYTGNCRFHSVITTDFGCNWKTYIEHLLATCSPGMPQADGSVLVWQWPVLAIRFAPGAMAVRQIVPRSFARTRVIEHFFFAQFADEASIAATVEAAKQRAAAGEVACQALQTEREADSVPQGESPMLAAFHAKVREAYARAPVDDHLKVEKDNDPPMDELPR